VFKCQVLVLTTETRHLEVDREEKSSKRSQVAEQVEDRRNNSICASLLNEPIQVSSCGIATFASMRIAELGFSAVTRAHISASQSEDHSGAQLLSLGGMGPADAHTALY